METERKLDVLADIARALNQSGVTWAVGGSLLLYFKGKTGVFRDIDLMVCETDVEKLKQAMLPLGAPAPSDPNAQYRTRCFLEFTVRGVDVDVMAGFVILENGQEHDCALKPEQVAEHILVRGEDIPLQSLEDWAQILRMDGPDIQGGDDRRKNNVSGAVVSSGSVPDGAAFAADAGPCPKGLQIRAGHRTLEWRGALCCRAN